MDERKKDDLEGKEIEEYVCIKECYYNKRVYSPHAPERKHRILRMAKGEKIHPSSVAYFKPLVGEEVPEDLNTIAKPVAMSESRSKTLTMADRQIEITKAIEVLGKGDFTSGGLPRTKSIEEMIGFEISGDERDLAWNEYQKENDNSNDGGS